MQPVIDRRQLLQRCACLALGGMGAAWARYAEAADNPAAAPEMRAYGALSLLEQRYAGARGERRQDRDTVSDSRGREPLCLHVFCERL